MLSWPLHTNATHEAVLGQAFDFFCQACLMCRERSPSGMFSPPRLSGPILAQTGLLEHPSHFLVEPSACVRPRSIRSALGDPQDLSCLDIGNPGKET